MNPQDFGKYQLLKKLATGGMAEVWLARQTGIEGFERLLVIKRILPHLAGDDEFVKMFLNEARIAARLSHPNIAQIFDLGASSDSYFLAMEFIHGEDLGRIMRKAWASGPWMAPAHALRAVADACAGLHYAHTKADESGRPLKIVHRDISPQNILVGFNGEVKVVDFGIAKAADQASLTRSGAIKGKFAYMAPEQAAGKPLDARSDIFALGLVLYELITGVRPLKRKTELETLQAALACDIKPPSQVASVPAALDEVVMKALQKTADDRYRDARAFQMAIEEALVNQRWIASSVQLSEFMHELFKDRLQEEERLGRPDPQSDPSGSGIPSPVEAPAGAGGEAPEEISASDLEPEEGLEQTQASSRRASTREERSDRRNSLGRYLERARPISASAKEKEKEREREKDKEKERSARAKKAAAFEVPDVPAWDAPEGRLQVGGSRRAQSGMAKARSASSDSGPSLPSEPSVESSAGLDSNAWEPPPGMLSGSISASAVAAAGELEEPPPPRPGVTSNSLPPLSMSGFLPQPAATEPPKPPPSGPKPKGKAPPTRVAPKRPADEDEPLDEEANDELEEPLSEVRRPPKKRVAPTRMLGQRDAALDADEEVAADGLDAEPEAQPRRRGRSARRPSEPESEQVDAEAPRARPSPAVRPRSSTPGRRSEPRASPQARPPPSFSPPAPYLAEPLPSEPEAPRARVEPLAPPAEEGGPQRKTWLKVSALVAVLAVAGGGVALFRDELAELFRGEPGRGEKNSIILRVDTQPQTMVEVRHAVHEGASRPVDLLGQTPLTVSSNVHLQDTIILTNSKQCLTWEEEIAFGEPNRLRSIDKKFAEGYLKLRTTPTVDGLSVWCGGEKKGESNGTRIMLFEGKVRLQLRGGRLKRPYEFDAEIIAGKTTEKVIDVSKSL